MTHTRSKLLLLAPIVLLLSFLLALIPQAQSDGSSDMKESRVNLTSEDSEQKMTDVVKNGKSDYTVYFASGDGITADTDLAKELTDTIRKKYDVTIRYRADTAAKAGKYEILLGKTNRAFSVEVYNEICAAASGDSLIWAIAEKDGQIAYVANSAEAFVMGKSDLLALLGDDSFSVPTGKTTVHTMSRADYDKYLKEEQDRIEAEEQAKRQERIEELKKLIAEFEYSQFGDAPTTSMTGDGYGKPYLYPNAGEHPRVNVTAEMLPDIIAYMKENESVYTVYSFWQLANKEYTGILPPAKEYKTGRIGCHNMDEEGLAVIEAKAFAYLLTGDELYAYEAIYAMKNYLVTIDIQWIHSDQCREFGRIMYCTAEVYDWCYDLLSDEDKAQFIMACADIGSSRNQNTDFGNQMEVGFPPKLQGCVSGHGSEHQVLRDYFSIAIAIFDEDPTWYEWVGGLIYNYFVPFRDYYFQSGTYPQGLNCYAGHRHNADLWSAWLFLCATGEIPYSDDFANVVRSFFMNETPNGTYFGTGDGDRQSSGATFWQHAVITSALYGDSALRAQAYKFTSGFKKYTANSLSFSYTQMLFLSARYHSLVDGDTAEVDRFFDTDPVCYFGSPLGQMTVRSQWNDENAAATFMKLGERSTANHEHADAGTFQIFYKGLYTGDSGIYDSYGSDHWTYYHTATVAHNGLLIFNPAKSSENPNSASTYFYSGGQRKLAETSQLATWLYSYYDTGEVTGVEWAYNSDGTTDYAYLGGDITAAYDQDTVSYVGRHMLTLYTGNEDVPMYFIVYDKITSKGEDFKKTFLLHTRNEPTIDTESGTVVMTQGDGRLVLKSLVGGDSITAVGGAGRTFEINGHQCTSVKGDGAEWGRVEISPTSEQLTHYMLNFMYVTDAESKTFVEPELVTAENMHGLIIDENVIIFAESEGDKNTSELRFNIEGTGLRRFMVMGMYGGTWNISVDGISVAHSVSSDEGGMITFYAPAGEIAITPGNNIAPSNGGRIIYNSFGGIVPDSAPLVYEVGVPVTLPTDIKNGDNIFLGWYTSPNYEEDTLVTDLVATETGKVQLYAKYKGVSFKEDYESDVFTVNKGSYNGLSYSGKDGSIFKTVTDEETGNTYLHITRGTLDPQIDATKKPTEYLFGDTKLTLVIDLARDDSTPLSSSCRIRGPLGAGDTISFFTTSTNGSVLLGGKTGVMTLTENFQTLAVTFDFAASTLTAYDDVGNVLAEITVTPPSVSQATTTLEWLKTLTYSINWWIGSGETLLVDNFTIYGGDYVPKPEVIPEGYSKINYVTNGGSFIGIPDKYYKEGTATLLEPNITKGNDEFLGWYTTPDFKTGTIVTEIGADVTGEFTVYAKWAGKLFNADFEGENVTVENKNQTVDGVDFSAKDKDGAIFRTEKDASGNTYVYWKKGSSDPQFKISNSLSYFNGSSAVTFMISLATVEGETPLSLQYRVRATSKTLTSTSQNNSIILFTTDTNGTVKLGGKTEIATLSSDKFTKIIATIDFEAKALLAYYEDGTLIAKVDFAIDDYKDWLTGLDFPMYLYPGAGESIKIDDVIINAAPYSPKETVVPSTMAKIDYITNGGFLPDGYPKYYTKGESLTLPTPSKPGATFIGWFKDEYFTEQITEITAEDTENFIIYAAWQTVMLDYDPSKIEFNYAGKADGSMGGSSANGVSFQTKGENSFYKTLTDDNGEKYLLWSKGAGDPQVNYGGTLSSAAENNLVISFTLSLAKDGENSFIGFQARMRTPSISGSRKEVQLFRVDTSGKLYLSSSTSDNALVGQFDASFKTFGIVADFGKGMLYGYGENGEKVCEIAMAIPGGFATAKDYYNAVTSGDILNIYAGGTQQTSVRIKRLAIETGNIFES